MPPAKSRVPLGREPAAAEGPVGEHRVDEHRPERGEDQERAEAHPLDHGAGDQRRGDDAEGRLEGQEDEVGDRRPFARREGDVVQADVAEAADQRAVAVEGERVADQRPETPATAIAPMHIMKVLSVFFERTRPA